MESSSLVAATVAVDTSAPSRANAFGRSVDAPSRF